MGDSSSGKGGRGGKKAGSASKATARAAAERDQQARAAAKRDQLTINRLGKIQGSVEKFGCTTKEWKGMVLIIDKKGRNIGHVKEDGTIVRKREGSKQLMGALIRDAIKEAL